MEELISEIANKRIRTNKESAILKLYSELGNFPSESITVNVRLNLISRVIDLNNLIYMNMRILAGTLLILHYQSIEKLELNRKNFDLIINSHLRELSSFKVDMFRYLRNLIINQV
jgi:hypothetical protein